MKSSKFSETFFPKRGQAVVTSYNALQHVTKGYNGFRILVTNYKVVQIPRQIFSRKMSKCYNKLQCVTTRY